MRFGNGKYEIVKQEGKNKCKPALRNCSYPCLDILGDRGFSFLRMCFMKLRLSSNSLGAGFPLVAERGCRCWQDL